ncbi:MAG: oligopeptide transport system permease protein [Halieaceae bacterium]|jgi:oligopeptide transport system permease protein
MKTEDTAPVIKSRSLWQDARRRLFANRAATFAFVVLLAIIVLAVAGPMFSSHEFDEISFETMYQAPTIGGEHLFGTDPLGRDLFTRTMMGARISLLLGVMATLVALVIGVSWGATAGYLGGRVDDLMMRFVDIMYSLPFMFFVIILMVVFGRNIFLIFVALGAVEWLTMARIVRGQTLALRHREFVEAAVATGVPTATIIRRHVIPNLLGPVVVYVTLTIPQIILVESFLSFLGLGVQEPLTSWGVLIKEGADEMETAAWLLIFPAFFLATTLFCFNFIGDGLRDALDPRDH